MAALSGTYFLGMYPEKFGFSNSETKINRGIKQASSIPIDSGTPKPLPERFYGIDFDDYINSDGTRTRDYYTTAVNIPDETGKYRPFNEIVKLTFENGNLVLRWYDKEVKLKPFIVYNSNVYTIQQIKQAYPNIEFSSFINNTFKGKYKYALNISNVPDSIKNNVNYVGLELIDAQNITWNDVSKDSENIYLTDGIKLNYRDLIDNGFTLNIINKSYLLIGNVSGKNYLWLDPTITYNNNSVSFSCQENETSLQAPPAPTPPNTDTDCHTDAALGAIDGNVRQTLSGASEYSFIEFGWNISEKSINNLTVKYSGNVLSAPLTSKVYVWNGTGNSWIDMATLNSVTVSSYVVPYMPEILTADNRIFVNVKAFDATSDIETDYIQVSFSYNPLLNQSLDNSTSYNSQTFNVTCNGYPSCFNTINDSSLLLYYSFNLNHTATENNITYDYSQYGNDGFVRNVYNANWTPNDSPFGGSYSFNTKTTNASILIKNNPNTKNFNLSDQTGLTISVFVRMDILTSATGASDIVSNDGAGNEIVLMEVSKNAGKLNPRFVIYNSTNGPILAVNKSLNLTTGEWYNLVGTFNTSSVRVYVNGLLSNETFMTPLGEHTSIDGSPFRIGAGSLGITSLMNGSIDEVMIFNRSLSEDEVLNLYNNQSYRFLTPATQLYNMTNITQDGTVDRINLTTNTTQLQGTNISVRIRGYNTAGVNLQNTSWVFIGNGLNNITNHSILTTVTNISIEFNYSTDSYNFYAPILHDSITILEWASGGTPASDTEYPIFSQYKDNNGTLIDTGLGMFNVTLNNTNGTVILNINGDTRLATNYSSYPNIFNASYNFASGGVFTYNWTAYGNGTSHNLNLSEDNFYTVNISAASPDPYPDFSIPVETPANNSFFTWNGDYVFNITVNNTNGTAWITFNGVNYTATNVSNNFTITIKGLTAGDNFYNWSSYGNGSSHFFNYSQDSRNYYLKQAPQNLTPLLNGLNTNLTTNYSREINASISSINWTALSIKINDTTIYRDINFTFASGTWIVNYSLPSNVNFTGNETNLNVTILKMEGNVTLHLNNTRANYTATNNSAYNIWVNGTLINGTGNIVLYWNSTLINNGTSQLSNLTNFTTGIYNYSCYIPPSQNYTEFTETWWVNITIQANVTDTTPPTWDNLRNITQTANISLSEAMTATDDIAIGTYYLNQTSNFTIGLTTGTITNTTRLDFEYVYWLNVSVNDTSNNVISGVFWINVTNPAPTPPAANVTAGITPTCRYKKLGYYNLRLPWMRQVGCL